MQEEVFVSAETNSLPRKSRACGLHTWYSGQSTVEMLKDVYIWSLLGTSAFGLGLLVPPFFSC
jgi:hypothetical protein